MTKEYLSEQPFLDFLESMYFKRYLQWKWLERLVNIDNFNILNVVYFLVCGTFKCVMKFSPLVVISSLVLYIIHSVPSEVTLPKYSIFL